MTNTPFPAPDLTVYVCVTNAFGTEPLIGGVFADWQAACLSVDGSDCLSWRELTGEDRMDFPRVWAHIENDGEVGYFLVEQTVVRGPS